MDNVQLSSDKEWNINRMISRRRFWCFASVFEESLRGEDASLTTYLNLTLVDILWLLTC